MDCLQACKTNRGSNTHEPAELQDSKMTTLCLTVSLHARGWEEAGGRDYSD